MTVGDEGDRVLESVSNHFRDSMQRVRCAGDMQYLRKDNFELRADFSHVSGAVRRGEQDVVMLHLCWPENSQGIQSYLGYIGVIVFLEVFSVHKVNFGI